MNLRELLKKEWFKQVATLIFIVGLIWGGIFAARAASNKIESSLALKREILIPEKAEPKAATAEVPQPTEARPKEEVKKEIAKTRPKTPSAAKITGSTTTRPDGTKVTIVSTAASTAPISTSCPAPNLSASSSSPLGVSVNDTTKTGLDTALRNYLNGLRWSSEISSLSQIIVCDAGDVGWTGQYNGSYSMAPSGDIVSASGYIILNTYYYKNQTDFADFMKWTLSHEYGHHYTLYHRWVDLDLSADKRFPTEYYNLRPLSQSSTAVDYSKGWQNCDSEIVAEDYSYFYSGYGIQQMNEYYGLALPSAATKTWIYNLASAQSAPAVDNPPSISISSPADSARLTGTFNFAANATDDLGIDKVNFYLDSALVSEDVSPPYQISIQTGDFSEGNHTLRAVAYDSAGHATEKSLTVSFISLKVSIIAPAENPYNWQSDDLLLRAKSEIGDIVKMELYINGALAASDDGATINRVWPYSQGDPGTYTLKARGYDASGNYAEASLTIIKH